MEDLWVEWDEVITEEVGDARWPTDGAWECTECASMNLRSKMKCGGCEVLRPSNHDWQEGDWNCKVCGNHNFHFRKRCMNTHCPTMVIKPGDWICWYCKNHNYSNNQLCNTKTCRLPKPI